jgi:hypothetical protein
LAAQYWQKRKAEQDRQNRTEEHDRQNRTGRTGPTGQDGQERTGLVGPDRQNGTAWTGFEAKKDDQDRTARKGQPERGTGRARLPWQNFEERHQDRTMTGLPTQDCKDKTTRTEQKEKTVRKGHVCKAARAEQPEQDCQNRTTRTRLPAQGCYKTAKAGQIGEDSRKGQPEQDS